MVGPKGSKVMGRMTAYAFFVQICRDEHKKQYPGELLQYQEFSKKCAERWRTMTELERKWFNQLEAKDKMRYEAEQAQVKGSGKTKTLKTGKVHKKMVGSGVREG
eukprot:GFUD01034763.1.p1 GENE.GFUD01034763.1~~GFUD01034763.1.p1  ORF type:complete len:105 (+),score=22.67 GFUD01034763.1:53-367(+)